MQGTLVMATCKRAGCDKEAVRKFCSTECKIVYHNANRPSAPKVKHKCAYCRKQFTGRPDAKTCSLNCRVNLHNLNKRNA